MSVNKNVERLQNQHDCFMHSGKWEDGTILEKHERESPEGYARRTKGFCSPDLYSYLIKTYGILFAKAPTRLNADPVYEQFIEDCGYGMDINGLLGMSLEMGAVLGSVALVIDSDKVQPSSLEGMLLSRSWPFIEMILPQDITELVVDRVGRIKKFAYEYYESSDETQAVLYTKTYENGSITTTHDEIDDKGNKSLAIDGVSDMPMGIMPVVMLVPSQEPIKTNTVPSSPTLGLYHQQYNIAITNSLIDESLYSQQFSVLTVFSDMQLTDVSLGTKNAMKLNPGDSASFISPPGTPIEMMLKRIDLSVSMMIRTFANMLTNGSVQSGDAKVIDRQVGALQLKNVSNYMQTIEYKIYEIFMAFMGKDVVTSGYDYTVEYFKDFDLTDLLSYISEATDVIGLNVSNTAKMEIRKSVLRKFLSGEDAEKVATIIDAEDNNKEIVGIDGVDTTGQEYNQDDNTSDRKTDDAIDPLVSIGSTDAVSNTALNGAQVAALLDILNNVKDAMIPKQSAKAIIQAAFPGISPSLIDSMLASIVPKAPVEVVG